MSTHYEVLIVGGGSAGITVAAKLMQSGQFTVIGIVEPAEWHYYQPIWTLVGAGEFDKEVSRRPMQECIPRGVQWVKGAVAAFQPGTKEVQLSDGSILSYDMLVIAAGIQIDWERTPGVQQVVGRPGSGVCSNYEYATVTSTWENIRSLKSGTAIFTHPSGAIKCGGAPMKIAFLAADYWRKKGVLNQIRVILTKPGGKIFGVDHYRPTFEKVVQRYGIEVLWNTNLKSIEPETKSARFINRKDNSETSVDYDMLHVTPFQSAPDFIRSSVLADEHGWVNVDKWTTQHKEFPEIFALGDCSNLPTSKTGAAIRKQAPVTVENILSFKKGEELAARYDGYTSCPVITGYGKLVMAEFDYDGQPAESFPFDQSKERYSMYALKAYGLPKLYWHGMLQGREF